MPWEKVKEDREMTIYEDRDNSHFNSEVVRILGIYLRLVDLTECMSGPSIPLALVSYCFWWAAKHSLSIVLTHEVLGVLHIEYASIIG